MTGCPGITWWDRAVPSFMDAGFRKAARYQKPFTHTHTNKKMTIKNTGYTEDFCCEDDLAVKRCSGLCGDQNVPGRLHKVDFGTPRGGYKKHVVLKQSIYYSAKISSQEFTREAPEVPTDARSGKLRSKRRKYRQNVTCFGTLSDSA